ncbi:MAG: iron ABC transporter permease [Clostridia bacterium]|nr:iron ABC transporter permease [Clostridia bacterium]
MKTKRETLSPAAYTVMTALLLVSLILCVCIGSVNLPLRDTAKAIFDGAVSLFTREALPSGGSHVIILRTRLPRVLCVALTGAALSLCGAAMQGLLRNPLADGSTLGVSGGASLGAVTAIALGLTIPGLPGGGIMVTAIVFAFLSLGLMLFLSYKIDHNMSTNTIILMGVVFSMFTTSIISIITVFSQEKVRTITFWTMGSLSNTNYINVLTILVAFAVCSLVLLCCSRELNAFAIGEENARHIGVNVKRVKLTVLIAVSALIGVCVSVGGSIGFVGLIIPHMSRRLFGANQRKLLPASIFSGAIFLLYADLVSRTVMRPLELPVGVVTSLIGTVTFIVIFARKGMK